MCPRNSGYNDDMEVTLKHVSLVLLAALCVTACSDVKSLRFTADNQEEVFEQVRNSRGLTGEEFELLFAARIRGALQGNHFAGKTVGEVIEDQRKLRDDLAAQEEESKRLAEEARQAEEAAAASMREFLTVVAYKKTFQEADYMSGIYEDCINIKFRFENKCTTDIRAFRGKVVFRDLFGEEIFTTGLTYDEGVDAGKTKTWPGSIDYNQFKDDHRKLRNTDLENMSVVWVPANILFKDGSMMGEEVETEWCRSSQPTT